MDEFKFKSVPGPRIKVPEEYIPDLLRLMKERNKVLRKALIDGVFDRLEKRGHADHA